MKFLVAFLGVAMILGPTVAEIEVSDPLECTPEEHDEASRAVPRAMDILYRPLLTKNFIELRNHLENENRVRWHVDCILYNKACTSVGKAMQHLVTSQSSGQLCRSCETTCLRRRLQVILKEIHCLYPQISEEVKNYFQQRDGVDIITFYIGNNPQC